MKKNFTKEQKQKALEMIKNGSTTEQVAKSVGASISVVYSWKKKSQGSVVRHKGRRPELITLTPSAEPKRSLMAFYGSPADVCQALEQIARVMQ